MTRKQGRTGRKPTDHQDFTPKSSRHVAVLGPVRYLKSCGTRVTILRVDREGRVDPDDVRAAIRSDTSLLSIMTANNETRGIQPISEIGEIAARAGITFHSDAAQAVGKVPVDVRKMGVDLLSIAAHKFGGPTGIGALYVRKGLRPTPLVHGAAHERGRRTLRISIISKDTAPDAMPRLAAAIGGRTATENTP